MDAAGLIVPLVLQGISILRTRYKNVKINEKESKLLEEFIDTINRCINATRKVGASSSSSTKKKSKPLPLVVTLTEVQKTLDEWSSDGSRFFWIFTDRTEKLEALKQKVDRALATHNLERMEEIFVKVVALDPQQPPSTVIDEKRTPTRDSRSSNKGKETKKPPRRSNSAEPPRKAPPKNQDVGSKDSNLQGPIHPPDPKPKPKTHTWVYLWAPLDSEKQAKDVEDKLKNIRDVKVEKVRCDQPAKKVKVKVKAVEVKDDSKIMKILLRETKDALPSFKVPPTLWKNRPK